MKHLCLFTRESIYVNIYSSPSNLSIERFFTVQLPQSTQRGRACTKSQTLALPWHLVRSSCLDHSFERGLSHVSATYSLREDGGITVLNQGYDQEDKEWSEATGKAYLVAEPQEGWLRVSFFGPFIVLILFLMLMINTEYAFVSGYDHDYLWLLSRKRTVSPDIKQRFLKDAKQRGFQTML